MKVSVIITTYNSARYIERCIKSVLSQGYDDLEVIVVDGGSTDGTIDIVNKYQSDGLNCYVTPGHVHVTRNLGIEKANGDIVIFLDSDDELMEGAIVTTVEKFKELGDKVGVLYAYALDDSGRLQGFRLTKEGYIDFHKHLCEELRYGNAFAAFRSPVIKQFRFEVPGYEFMLHKRVVKKFGGYFIPRALLRYHNLENPASLSKRISKPRFREEYGKRIADELRRYLIEFKEAFLEKCPRTYSRLLMHAGVLYLWSGRRSSSLLLFMECFKYHPSLRPLVYTLLAFIPVRLLLRFLRAKVNG
ncbi:MAG: glycosyltransferase [Thermoproteota archaeon]